MKNKNEKAAPAATADQSQDEKRNILLGTISYTNDEDYEKFLSNLDINQSMFVLIAAANYGQAKGLFNLDESELIAKSIKTIKRSSTPVDAEPVVSEESNS